MRTSQSLVEREKRRVESLSQRNVERIPAAHRIAQFPSPIQQPSVAVPVTRPVPQVGYRLVGGSPVQPPAQVLGADDTHHLDIDDLRRRLVRVGGQSGGDRM